MFFVFSTFYFTFIIHRYQCLFVFFILKCNPCSPQHSTPSHAHYKETLNNFNELSWKGKNFIANNGELINLNFDIVELTSYLLPLYASEDRIWVTSTIHIHTDRQIDIARVYTMHWRCKHTAWRRYPFLTITAFVTVVVVSKKKTNLWSWTFCVIIPWVVNFLHLRIRLSLI